MGLFAHHVHIRPWEIGLLTVEQFEGMCQFVDDIEAEAQKAARKK